MAEAKLAPGPLNIQNVFGDEFLLPVTWSASLAGCTQFESKVVLVNNTGTATINVVTDLENNKFDLVLDEAESVKIPVGTHRWYVKWTDPEGTRRTYLSGAYVVRAA